MSAAAADRVAEILQCEAHNPDALMQVPALLAEVLQELPVLMQAAQARASMPEDLEPASVADALAAQLDDALSVDHPLHLAEWFADHSELLDPVSADALDVFAMALEQAETARLALQRSIRAANLQRAVA
ncbi:MAG: hypothetical protein VKM98_10035 [Cyanobacteriota bacterium]|nr:hypothetical protein [Cyanobacteriota bacterium]